MSWRTFKFFELEELKDPDTNQPYDKLKVRAELSKKCSFRVDLMSYKHTKFHRNLFFISGDWNHLLQLWQRADDLGRYPETYAYVQ